ncbi:hypothetical protein ITJ66_02415 [Plantibacter sp. VKM Ac-2885]|uniref:hypothetical protein n=1 Tax=Plantibacter sp. VKM Ac-2885 TaxID=2783828 RepID=UPI00188ABD04|nr:hypothetical protein [Plantibacter sp. VKM Ac-2885]MBF4511327.1 hypothetical protein [Plantibacter sp. VKM Ac-2885]
MTSYSATATRDGKWWMIRVDGIDGLTQARHLGEAELMAREFVAASTDEALDNVSVELRVLEANGVSDIADRVARIQGERKTAAWLESCALVETAGLAAELVGADVPMRDVGVVLGVSHQRVSQLVNSAYRERLESPLPGVSWSAYTHALNVRECAGRPNSEVEIILTQANEALDRLRDALDRTARADDESASEQHTAQRA